MHKALPELRGKDLACWCKEGEPCHADVLLELANPPDPNQSLTISLISYDNLLPPSCNSFKIPVCPEESGCSKGGKEGNEETKTK